MSSDVLWGPDKSALERLRPLAEPQAASVANPSQSHLQEFASVIENVIVPRLLMSHAPGESMPETSLGAAAVSDFVDMTMGDDSDVAVGFIRHLLHQGLPFQNVLLDLLAPAARELGERWVHDSSSFVEVTLGVARMHRILREFDGVPAHLWSQAGAGRHALILPTPGEHHTFGLRLLQEFLLRESWTVSNRPVETVAQLEEVVSDEYFDFAGLSLSGETLIEPFFCSIRTIRKASRNKRIRIIVGGQLFATRPELISQCGADAFGPDAPSSVSILNGWAESLAPAT